MDIRLMRLTWSVIDQAPNKPGQTLLPDHVSPCTSSLSLSEQINAFVRKIENQVVLSAQERQQVQQYLSERTHLIQDLYQAQVM